MLRGIAAATSSASAAPIPVREAPAAAASANAGPQPSAVTPVELATPQGSLAAAPQVFRFNSTEFVYRQDIGRIILIGQSPVTGERKIQIPSEEALRAYERTIKADEQRSLLSPEPKAEPVEPKRTAAPFVTTPKAPPLPSLPQALTAALGSGDPSSGAVDVSA
jgi:hypothetical protein